MYLSVMHFKWTNVVYLSMDMLISSMMDVVIISAKLVCHLCFVCKLNYLFGAHMRYGGVTITFQHQCTTRNIHFYDENVNDESKTIIEERFL